MHDVYSKDLNTDFVINYECLLFVKVNIIPQALVYNGLNERGDSNGILIINDFLSWMNI